MMIPTIIRRSLPVLSAFGALTSAVRATDPAPTHADVRYGENPRNVLDVWLAKSDTPTPLVIYIHGGGFKSGDKAKLHQTEVLNSFLEAGISVAAINYRYMTGELLGVRASLYDSRRAVQFIRSQAGEWNIDKRRIGAFGGSAGTGMALWLGFHDDMAEPKSSDPVLRESTRLAVVGGENAQATYDLLRWPEFLPVDKAQPNLWRFFGLANAAELDSPKGRAVRAELDMLGLMSKDDAPLYVSNRTTRADDLNHDPRHAAALKKRADEVGLEAVVYAPSLGLSPAPGADVSLVEFFVKHLKPKLSL